MRLLPFAGFTGQAPWRLLWLPGAAMSAEDVLAQRWDAEAAALGLDIDMQAVDLQAERFDGADAIDALLAELRALRAQVPRLWLGGISLGGWQSALCAQRAPGLLDGLCLLAPYPGDRLAWNAIEQDGGLDVWPGPDAQQAHDPAFEVWHWWRERERHAQGPQVWMAFGRHDRFADGMERMAARLPAARVHRLEGGHDWACWRPAFSFFLAQQAARGAAGGAP